MHIISFDVRHFSLFVVIMIIMIRGQLRINPAAFFCYHEVLCV